MSSSRSLPPLVMMLLLPLLCTARAPASSASSMKAVADALSNSFLLQEALSAVNFNCTACKAVLTVADSLLQTNKTTEQLLDLVVEKICLGLFLVPSPPVMHPEVCTGIVRLYGPEVVYIFNHTTLSHTEMCSFILSGQNCHSSLPLWDVEIPPGKPPVSHPHPQEGPTTIKILHISDVHIDPLYVAGTPVDCEYPLCCREWGGQNPPLDNATLAGYWGAENGACDIPIRTFELLLAQAAEHRPDLVYVTGDHPPHDSWMQTRESNLGAAKVVNEAIMKAFPDTIVLHSLGNHEAVPLDSFPVPAVYADGFTIDYLYNYLANYWLLQGLPEEAASTVQKGGYYSYSPLRGLRVIAVNMNYCNYGNWWLLVDNMDPTDQLAWLAQQLASAEAAGEHVHILDHISTGSPSCEPVWSHAINTLYTRFESTIRAVFSGHHHCDQFRMLWDTEDNTRPVGVSYLVPSVSSGWRKSPAFRVFTIDGGYPNATWLPLDHHTYTLNLTTANQEGQGSTPMFELAYSAKEAYGLDSLSPEAWAELAWTMATDDTQFQEYMRHYFNYWAEPEELVTCTAECRKSLLCSAYTGDTMDKEPCQRIMDQVDAPAV